MKLNYDNLINAKLSGKTYDECLLNCENFVKEIDNSCHEISNLIMNLQRIYNNYQMFYEKTNITVGGSNG